MRIEDGATGQHQIGAFDTDAIVVGALLIIHAEQAVDGGGDARILHPDAVDAAAVVTGEVEMDAGQRRHGARGAEQVHAVEVAAMLGRERRDVAGNLLHHARIGFLRHVAAAVMLRQCHHAERDRHPALDAWLTWLAAGIALDPHQLGRAAADIEQDGATAPGVEQRRAADHRKRRLGLAVDHFEPDAGLGLDAIPKAIGVRGRAAGLGRDQAKAAGLPGLDLVAADRERGNGALDRRFADAAGGGDALAQPDDAGKGIDHAKAVAGRTGDQEPAIIGAEVERRIDLGRSFGRSLRRLGPARAARPPPRPLPGPQLAGLRTAGHGEAACHHSFKLSFRGRRRPARNGLFASNCSSAKGVCNNLQHWDYV